MCSRFQAATLVASPSYPNSITWSEENLIAVASGHLVTILNPELPLGPRGLIKVPSSEILPIGVIPREDLLSGCMLPTCVSRDHDPCVRSISWSPLGLAPNSGCLLAICTTEGRVKLYRPPFCDYSAEWIEIIDISEMLYVYFAGVNFKQHGAPSSGRNDKLAGKHDDLADQPNLDRKRERKRRRLKEHGTISQDNYETSSSSAEEISSPSDSDNDAELQHNGLPKVPELEVENLQEDQPRQNVSRSRPKYSRRKTESSGFPLITADQYASRSAMLSSLVIAWSPLLQLSSEWCPDDQNRSSRFSLLAVGGKSGGISFWRIDVPPCYSIEHVDDPPPAVLVGFLQAHTSWITAICWAVLSHDSSIPQVLLATGSSKGSVKIWLGDPGEILKSLETTYSPFVLLKEITTAETVPSAVSVLSLTVLTQSPHKVLLAVGKGSGSFEVWACDKSSNQFEKIGSSDIHDHVVMGLAWAFGGQCLYSCSEDNFVRGWRVSEDSLSEIPLPSSEPGQRGFTDLPNTFYSCFGVAVSPGNVAIAMVRSFRSDLLNPMYQSRSLKAAVEFFWIGGQHTDISAKTSLNYNDQPGFSEQEMFSWESNLLWSLKQYESTTKPLVVWDIIAALLAFKNTMPEYVEHVLEEWLSVSYLGLNEKTSTEKVFSQVSRKFSDYTCRQLHLLYVVCRRVALSELNADEINSKLWKQGSACQIEDDEASVWLEMALGCEREIRERIVGFSFSACLNLTSDAKRRAPLSGHWFPVGLAQMEQWAAHQPVQGQIKTLASKLRTHKKRLRSGQYEPKEQCSYCSALVPFESAEFVSCQGVDCKNGKGKQCHKLVRCAVSMQICPPTTPLWYCICCHRRILKLTPEPLFTLTRHPENFISFLKSSAREVVTKPGCPFCGILLQRVQPDFLLSPVPV